MVEAHPWGLDEGDIHVLFLHQLRLWHSLNPTHSCCLQVTLGKLFIYQCFTVILGSPCLKSRVNIKKYKPTMCSGLLWVCRAGVEEGWKYERKSYWQLFLVWPLAGHPTFPNCIRIFRVTDQSGKAIFMKARSRVSFKARVLFAYSVPLSHMA